MIYCDTSFLIPAFRKEATSSKIQRFLQRQVTGDLAISHWVRVEFSSVLARDVRMGAMDAQTAIELDRQFEIVDANAFIIILPDRNDFDLCKRYLRQFDTGLRAGDAFHLAIATNHGARKIITLDKKLLHAGKLLRLPVEAGILGRS